MNYGMANRDIKKGEWVESKDLDFRASREQLIDEGNVPAMKEIINEMHNDMIRRSKMHHEDRIKFREFKDVLKEMVEKINDIF